VRPASERAFSRTAAGQRIAFFGGTFDPPHRGHAAIARAAADAFALDRVLFAPVGRQPLKPGESSTPWRDRLAMTELLCREDSRFEATTIDAPLPNGQPNYTVDTLIHLLEQRPNDVIFGLSGADSFLTLRHWHQPDRLLELVGWIVVSRPGFPLHNLDSLHLSPAQRDRIHLIESVHEDISATSLRQRLSRGDSCTDQLSEPISAYIAEQHLYASSRT
jgi:nicotinate-nucleotide adenylyltransferase